MEILDRDELEMSLQAMKPGDAEPLRMLRCYCHKTQEPPKGFLDCISPRVMDELDKRQKYLLSDNCIVEDLMFDLNTDSLSELKESANTLLSPDFKLLDSQGVLRTFPVLDATEKIVAPALIGDAHSIMVRSLCRRYERLTGEPLRHTLANQLISLWTDHIDGLTEMPKPMASVGENVWTFHRPRHQPNGSMKIPYWHRILVRMSDPEAFAAWVWGVYKGDFKGRLILWLHGPNGEDGKSTISKIIGTELFGAAYQGLSSAVMSGDKRFVLSFFESCALVVYPDASNRKVLLTELFKSIASAGDDPVMIEPKNKQAYSAFLKARLWINSNFSPEIPDEGFATSRLLYIKIAPMVNEAPDPTVKEKLIAELPGFLAYAQAAYEKRCTDDYKIVVNDTVKKQMVELTGVFFEEFESAFDKYFERCEPEGYVQAQTVRERCRNERITGHAYTKFLSWLESTQGVERKKLSSENGRTFFCGMRLRQPGTAANDPANVDVGKPGFGAAKAGREEAI